MKKRNILPVVACAAAVVFPQMTLAAAQSAQATYAANIAAGMKTPATSKLFVKFADPKTGVISYLVKPGSIAFNQQSLYFTAKSMTDDGRFLVFSVCNDEFPPEKHGKRVFL